MSAKYFLNWHAKSGGHGPQPLNIMTIEKESIEAEVYAPYNPYELDNMSDAGSEAALSTTDSVSSRRLGSLASNTKAFGRLDSVNNHHKTTLGGVQKV